MACINGTNGTNGINGHRRPHCIILSLPFIGHINPMLQFAKRLHQRGAHVTFFLTKYVAKTTPFSSPDISVHIISDGFDDGFPPGICPSEIIAQFLGVVPVKLKEAFEKVAEESGRPIDCIVYDSVIPSAVEIAEELGIPAAMFCTQSCAVDKIFYEAHRGKLKVPVGNGEGEVLVPGLPVLEVGDLPSFIHGYGYESYPGLARVVVEQFQGVEKAKWVFINTFYELEAKVIDDMAKSLPVKAIGPAIPSKYLDNRLPDDAEYGLSLFTPATSICLDWLKERPPNSVVYVSFGSLARLGHDQMVELAWGLKMSNHHFLWIVRSSEHAKLPHEFVQQTSKQGLVVTWGPQLDILGHPATSCFFTHCGWNSTLETLSLGVPVVAMPQWTDQTTNAKWMKDVWKTGVRVVAETKSGVVGREAIAEYVKEVMEGERAEEIRMNAQKWKKLARGAMEEGGSSDKNIEEFVRALAKGH